MNRARAARSKYDHDALIAIIDGIQEMVPDDDDIALEALGRALAVLKDDYWERTTTDAQLRRRPPPKKHLSVRASPSFASIGEKDEYTELCGRLTLVVDEEEWHAVKTAVRGQLDGRGNLAYIEMIVDMQLRASRSESDEVGVNDDADVAEAIEQLVERTEVP